ncbi:Nonselective cation channel [Rhizoctonia solani]|uniref:Nonselective cation channel n=1 Tax=Rhizoctonia solani TaxID=456999 RepID=A0A8H7H5E2_9AGAM|nr:Nonselective cation channel [Rhizoctonia solani]
MDSRDVEDEAAPLLTSELMSNTPVWPIIHEIKADVMQFIDTPFSWETLTSTESTYTIVVPLHEKYKSKNNLSVTFCFLLNRVHFLRDQNISTAPLSQTRAALCEILAIRSLREHADSTLQLATACTTPWPIFAGAPEQVRDFAEKNADEFDIRERVGNAIEMAIVGSAKRFIKSSACQKVIDAIYWGHIVYQASSDHSILADTYKLKPIHFYDPHRAPLLNHYRLKVPVIRGVLEYINFVLLFVLFVVALELNEKSTINMPEGLFMIYGLGFVIEKLAAMQEHGIRLWNGFDMAFVTVYFSYAGLRLYGIRWDEAWARELGIDILAVVAVIVFPRLAFVTLSNNLMVLSLRSMFTEFAVLMLVAAFCFGGFLYALWTLGRDTRYGSGQIAWWMLDLWFGLDASGFDRACMWNFQTVGDGHLRLFHSKPNSTHNLDHYSPDILCLFEQYTPFDSPRFGYNISNDAAMEAMFRRAVSTIEGRRNIFLPAPHELDSLDGNATCKFYTLTKMVSQSERYHDQVRLIRLILGKLGGSSFAILRITGFPILLAISFYERQKAAAEAESMFEKVTNVAERFVTLPRRLKRMTLFEGAVGSSGNVQAIFELDDEFNPSPIIGDSLTWPCQLESSESEPPPLPSEKFKRPERPKLDTIMSASSAGEGQSISERTPRPTGSNQLGGPYHEIALENHNGAFQANSSRDQIPSSISTQLNNGFLAPIQRRNRRKSTFEPRLVPNRTEAASLSVPPANFTSPLAQLFSPIISEPPDGGFNAPNTTIGQRRTLRKSGGDQQTAPGVAMFRRRALTGMVGGAGTSSSALSTTPGEEKEPSEAAGNLEDDDNWISLRARMTQMEDKLQRIEIMLQKLTNRLE